MDPPRAAGPSPDRALRVFIVAGEASGDALAGPLMAALRSQLGGAVAFAGVGGERMAEQGLSSLFPMSELSLMGLVEVLPHLPTLLRRLRQTEAAIRAWQPDVLVTVDSPGFNFRLAKRLLGSGIPIVHYVAPTVWAWRPGRARRIAPLLRHLLVLLPFEPPWFERWGLPATYVGHPALETVAAVSRAARPTADSSSPPRLCLLPGSRRGELARHLPIFADAVARLRQRHPGLTTILPTVPWLASEVRAAVRDWPDPPEVIDDRRVALQAMAQSDAALAASGTVTLELALLGTPFVAAYRAHPLTAALVRRLIRVKYATLVNLVLERGAVPELLQENCRAELMAAELDRLLSDPGAVAAQRAAFAELAQRLAVDAPPSERAATIVAAIGEERRKSVSGG